MKDIGFRRLLGAIGLAPGELVFLVCIFAYYSLWIVRPCLCGTNPDELMRLEVTHFLFAYDRLPVGSELMSKSFGFSYAHIPTMLCNVLGYWFMCIANWIGFSEPRHLILAARMVSVVSGTFLVYWTIRAGRLLFVSSERWIMVCIVALTPQIASLSSYVNNDIEALCGASMIFYSWISAMRSGWRLGNLAALAIGMSICIMSYYNSYFWVLCSMMMLPMICFVRDGADVRTAIRTCAVVAVATFVLSGYLFIRHVYLYGDLLGFATERHFAEVQGLIRNGYHVNQDAIVLRASLWEMLFGMDWFSRSFSSGIGVFVYGEGWPLPIKALRVYQGLFAAGLVGCLLLLATRIRQRRLPSILSLCFWAAMMICIVGTIGLSIGYSYGRDFQPQGRYCMPALLPIVLLVTRGIEELLSRLAYEKMRTALVGLCCLSLCAVSLWSYHYVFFVVDK